MRDDLAAAALADFRQQIAEASEGRHQHLVAGRDDRDQDRLDAGARGAVDQERPFVFGADRADERAPSSRSCRP